MSFIDILWLVVAIIGGHVVSSSIIAVAKKAICFLMKGFE
jgi:hypothetical protein